MFHHQASNVKRIALPSRLLNKFIIRTSHGVLHAPGQPAASSNIPPAIYGPQIAPNSSWVLEAARTLAPIPNLNPDTLIRTRPRVYPPAHVGIDGFKQAGMTHPSVRPVGFWFIRWLTGSTCPSLANARMQRTDTQPLPCILACTRVSLLRGDLIANRSVELEAESRCTLRDRVDDVSLAFSAVSMGTRQDHGCALLFLKGPSNHSANFRGSGYCSRSWGKWSVDWQLLRE